MRAPAASRSCTEVVSAGCLGDRAGPAARHGSSRPRPRPQVSSTTTVHVFSAPGEGREAVEIARRVLHEAARGVPFDQMAVLLRAPQTYLGLLEHAFARAGIPAWFERGTRRPDPAGRAFLALLACADESLSARRFAEYLSLAQVPHLVVGSGTAGTILCRRRRFRPTTQFLPRCRATRSLRTPRRSTRRRRRPNAMAIASSPARCARRGAGRSCWSRPT